jgi:hypothetical protein
VWVCIVYSEKKKKKRKSHLHNPPTIKNRPAKTPMVIKMAEAAATPLSPLLLLPRGSTDGDGNGVGLFVGWPVGEMGVEVMDEVTTTAPGTSVVTAV